MIVIKNLIKMINLNCLKKLMNAQTKVSIEILDQV